MVFLACSVTMVRVSDLPFSGNQLLLNGFWKVFTELVLTIQPKMEASIALAAHPNRDLQSHLTISSKREGKELRGGMHHTGRRSAGPGPILLFWDSERDTGGRQRGMKYKEILGQGRSQV